MLRVPDNPLLTVRVAVTIKKGRGGGYALIAEKAVVGARESDRMIDAATSMVKARELARTLAKEAGWAKHELVFETRVPGLLWVFKTKWSPPTGVALVDGRWVKTEE